MRQHLSYSLNVIVFSYSTWIHDDDWNRRGDVFELSRYSEFLQNSLIHRCARVIAPAFLSSAVLLPSVFLPSSLSLSLPLDICFPARSPH